MPKKSKQRDNTLKSSVEFDKLSPQSRIIRRERGVESRYHREVKGWSCGTVAKIENRQKVDRQKGTREWRTEAKGVRQGGSRQSRLAWKGDGGGSEEANGEGICSPMKSIT